MKITIEMDDMVLGLVDAMAKNEGASTESLLSNLVIEGMLRRAEAAMKRTEPQGKPQ